MAAAALGFAVLGIIGGAVQQRKVAKAQRKQNKIANRTAAIKRSRDIRLAIAQRRIQVAEAQSAGFSLGVAGSTAVQGATAGLTSDTASSIKASNVQFTGQQQIASLQDDISGFQQTAGNFQALTSVASLFVGGTGSAGSQNRAAVGEVFESITG